jgi:hypothetical protein
MLLEVDHHRRFAALFIGDELDSGHSRLHKHSTPKAAAASFWV